VRDARELGATFVRQLSDHGLTPEAVDALLVRLAEGAVADFERQMTSATAGPPR
jgi:hypothetical protein